ncbi:MAG: DUF3341 domain-containing protein [Myxococcota bacterium]
MASVLGVLRTPQATVGAIKTLKQAGFQDLEVYSPTPSHEIEEALERPPSRVRLYTLIGCLTGVTLGYLMQIWMAYNWPLVIGGKPFASIPAYTIIGFELNILVGGILTVVGFLVHGLYMSRKGHEAYQSSFSGDDFGCVVGCHTDQISRVQGLLGGAGCTEVRVVES